MTIRDPVPPTQASEAVSTHERRHHRRVRNRRYLQSPLGEVVDFSAGGLQIFRKGGRILHVGQTAALRLEQAGQALTITARVAWIKPLGFRRHAIGFAFESLPPTTAGRLRALVDQAHAEFLGPAAYLAE